MQISRYLAARFRDPMAQRVARRYLDSVGRGGFLPELWYDVFEFIYYDPNVPLIDPHTVRWPLSRSSSGASCKDDGAPPAVQTGVGGPAAPPALCYGDGKLAWLLQREGEGRD